MGWDVEANGAGRLFACLVCPSCEVRACVCALVAFTPPDSCPFLLSASSLAQGDGKNGFSRSFL